MRGRTLACITLVVLLAALALVQPVDHDESQYVAATSLVARGLIPYRDFAYFQMPLQPFLLAPVVLMAGSWAWPALRIANALLAAVAIGFMGAAARAAGATRSMAMVAAALFAGCDILLFSAGTARNDALPAALFAIALWLAMRGDATGRRRAAAIGLLLAGAAAAKISYALPAAAYGCWAMFHRDRRPIWVAVGALPVILFIAWTFVLSPGGFLFETLYFPARAPTEYYQARPAKLRASTKLLDTIKFLALGAALPALVVAMRAAWAARRVQLIDVLIVAGLIAALLPTPTWRQYLLPLLPPLFVALALAWTQRRPSTPVIVLFAIFAAAGLAPTVIRLINDSDRMSLVEASQQGRAIGRAMDGQDVTGPIATLAPQYLPAAGRIVAPVFAPGPFYYRSRTLLSLRQEQALHLLSRARPRGAPVAILTGAENGRTAGDPILDVEMARWGRSLGYRETILSGTPFRLFTPPRGDRRNADSGR